MKEMTYEDLVNKYNELVEKYNSLAIRYDMRKAEVIPNKRREEQTIKYLLCSKCYNKTGLPLFSFGKNRRFEFRKLLMDFTKCKFCYKKGDEYKCELTHFCK